MKTNYSLSNPAIKIKRGISKQRIPFGRMAAMAFLTLLSLTSIQKTIAQCTIGNISSPSSLQVQATQVIGQSLTTSCSGVVKQASFHLPSATPGDQIVIFLRVYAGNGLTNSLFPQAIPVQAVVDANKDAVIAFPTAIFILANNQYTFTAFATVPWTVGKSDANPYSGGNAYIQVSPSVVAAQPATDFAFTVKVCSPTSSTTTITACDSAVWNGVTYYTSGSYSKVFPGANTGGCDSTAYLDLTVNYADTSDETVTVCNSYTWKGNTYKASGDYTFDTLTVNGCDSFMRLHLTITSIHSTYTKIDAGCNNSATGSITITPIDGDGPYTYKIGTLSPFTTVPSNSYTYQNLKAGTYRITILDSKGCQGISDQITIGQNAALTFSIANSNPTCSNNSNGSITATPTSGIAPFQYKLGTSGTYGSSNTFSGLKGGSFRVFIKDAAGCESNKVAVLVQPTKISSTVIKTNTSCPYTSDGSATINGTGGTPPLTYRYGSVGTFSSNNTFTNLKVGSYRIYINDANNCSGYSTLVTIASSVPFCAPPVVKSANVDEVEKAVSFEPVLSPNPSSNIFTLITHSNKQQPVSVKVLDLNGKIVLTAKVQPEQSFRFGDKLPNGLYAIEVRQGDDVKTIKAVKGK